MVDRSRLSSANNTNRLSIFYRSRYLSKLTIPINSSKLVFHLFPSLSSNICRSKLKRGNSNVWGLIKIDLRSKRFTINLLHLHLLSRNVSSFHTKARKRRISLMMIYKFYTLDSICKVDNLKRRSCQQICLY